MILIVGLVVGSMKYETCKLIFLNFLFTWVVSQNFCIFLYLYNEVVKLKMRRSYDEMDD